jgi:hypothetical protein
LSVGFLAATIEADESTSIGEEKEAGEFGSGAAALRVASR